MFLELHKIIETKPSNNITYEGGIGHNKQVASKKPLFNNIVTNRFYLETSKEK